MSDLISRQAAIAAAERESTQDGAYGYMDTRSIIDMLKDAPSANVREDIRGRWIWDDEGYHCSECLFHAYGNSLECADGTYRFCPNCGAKMERSEE